MKKIVDLSAELASRDYIRVDNIEEVAIYQVVTILSRLKLLFLRL
jgi:hypothetical protein